MAKKNMLNESIPYQVESFIRELGQNLKTARLRRNLSIQSVADKIGVSRNLVAAAEKGSLTSSISLYIALLWAYDLQSTATDIANPLKDEVGLQLARLKEPKKSRTIKGLDNDF
ncbi:MAG: helix-turn-helix domain-containing protein [Alphaproteobacteria bacterium]|nr:helix-turn-helix domain-containing protein [Alphaproteobacteria bacterium]